MDCVLFVVFHICFRCSMNTDTTWKSDTYLSTLAAPSDSSQLKNVDFYFFFICMILVFVRKYESIPECAL